MESNHFVRDLGMDPVGGHKLPDDIGWVHQVVVKPKDTGLCYVEFLSELTSPQQIAAANNLEALRFDLSIRPSGSNKTEVVQRFKIDVAEIIKNSRGNDYCVYKSFMSCWFFWRQ